MNYRRLGRAGLQVTENTKAPVLVAAPTDQMMVRIEEILAG